MKKIVLSTMGALFVTAVMFSCNQPKETEVLPTTAKAGEEPLSVIDQMEKEEGVKFFKKDVTFIDEKSGNKVVIRFAAQNNDLLEQHLEGFNYAVIPLFRNEFSTVKEPVALSSTFINEKKRSDMPKLHSGIITEILNADLSGQIVGYSIKVSPKEIRAKNGKLLVQDIYWENVSMNWPERMDISVENDNGVRSINVGLEKKDRWYDSWHPMASWTQFYSEANSIKYYNDLNVDGPWRVMARVY